uniref:Protein cramped-like n=1 Tax=Sinocyclocheilus anshuiensis TaxID=1608454 RepID=A0A671Q4Z0_9TELE
MSSFQVDRCFVSRKMFTIMLRLSAAGSAGSSGAGGTSRSAPKGQGPAEKEEGGSQKRVRRQWESWSTEDKNSFFEGLYEHGKDFEAIQNNIALKYKKKGKPASMVKNKEQVRHFYYRTWHKISKHIDFNNVYSRVLKKSSQELYGLIYYAELRKKVGGLMDDKNVAKLNELIQQGATTVRSKGRNLRIKAPMCRALKKLCDPDGVSDEEDQKPVRLPLKVAVELQPRSNHSWARVQSLAHNPRLRMVVELHRKVSTLIEFLKQKWAVQDQRIRKSLAEREALDGLAQSSESEDLFLFPAENSTVTTLPGVARVVHSKASCTVHWQESGRGRTGIRDLPAAHILGIQPARGKSGKYGPVVGDLKKSDGHPVDSPDSGTSAPGLETNVNPNLSSTSPVSPTLSPSLPIGPEGNVVGTLEQEAASQTQTDASGRDKETVTQGDPAPIESRSEEPGMAGGVASEKAAPPQSEPQGRSEEVSGTGRSPQQIQNEGWSSQGFENVTLAEVYLMLGKPGKLQLEYEWQPKPQPSALPTTQSVLRCLLRLVSSEVNPKPTPEVCSVGTSPLKSGQEDSSVTPPGRAPAGATRSPSWGRQQHAAHVFSTGGRNLSHSLLASGGDSEGFAVPTTLPPNSSRQLRMFSPNKEAELAFRQQLDSISSDIFSKQRKIGRGRPLRKPLVVQRTLLPRTTGDTSPHVCSFSILSNSSATGNKSTQMRNKLHKYLDTYAPSVDKAIVESEEAMDSAPAAPELEPDLLDQEPSEVRTNSLPISSFTFRCTIHILVCLFSFYSLYLQESLQNGVSPPSPGGGDSLLAPPSVASLLDISLPGPPEESLPSGEPQTQISDSIIELAINSSYIYSLIFDLSVSFSGDGSLLSPPKLNGSDRSKLLPSSCDSWMPSPTHDPQWYPSDSTDSSLGCLLSSLASPDNKTRRTALPPLSNTALLGPSLLDSNSHDCFQSRGLPDVAEVDTQLACMMSESSVDYIARFNDLAQELSVTEPTLPPRPED